MADELPAQDLPGAVDGAGRMNPALLSSERLDWETPQDLFDALDREFGFELDVCATAENSKVADFFSPAVDGLSQTWAPRVCWCNPPYGRAIGTWVGKAYEESRQGATVVLLIPARTETAYWHDYVMRGEVRFLRGRLKFVGARYNAPFPSAVVVFRPGEPSSTRQVRLLRAAKQEAS